uniref:DENN domain containing 6B n=1 Tax=Serinus canaria TaxID=9135 RepID=A0A8C9MLH4_SERCA
MGWGSPTPQHLKLCAYTREDQDEGRAEGACQVSSGWLSGSSGAMGSSGWKVSWPRALWGWQSSWRLQGAALALVSSPGRAQQPQELPSGCGHVQGTELGQGVGDKNCCPGASRRGKALPEQEIERWGERETSSLLSSTSVDWEAKEALGRRSWFSAHPHPRIPAGNGAGIALRVGKGRAGCPWVQSQQEGTEPELSLLCVPGDLPKQVKVKKLAKLKTLDTKPGIYTSYKTFLHKDKTLIKRLLKGIQRKRPSEVQSALLRRHLLELTQSFIIPLEHYMASLMPLQRAITPWKNPPQIRPFCQEDFMKSLEHAGPQLTCVLKGDWLGLYRRFFKSPNFDGWFRQRHREMTQKLEALHLEAICEADIVAWMKDKSEVEIVDLVLKLREKLVRARCQHLPVKEETLQRVGLYIDTIIGSLPEDLQTVLHHP